MHTKIEIGIKNANYTISSNGITIPNNEKIHGDEYISVFTASNAI